MRLLVGLGLLLASIGTYADIAQQSLSIEAGPSLAILGSQSPTQGLGLVDYRYTENHWFVGGGIGGWAGSRATTLAHAIIGFNYADVSLGTGPAVISTTSSSLSTHYQFVSNLRWTFNPYPVFIGWEHVSNGASLWNGPGPNYGENFVTLGYVYYF